MSILIWLGIGIALMGILYFLFRKKNDDPYSGSFLERGTSRVSDGCKKLLDKIRGC